jgi:hypothetical protein
MASIPENSLDVPKINTNQMNDIFKEISASFKMTARTTPLWICGRAQNFGFRPSLERDFLPNITRDWVKKLEGGYVMITPLVFYTCDANNTENVEERGEKESDPNFLVYNHYNVLLSYLDANGEIQVERYEPSRAASQGNLHEMLSSLIVGLFKNYTNRSVKFNLVTPKGLQAIYKDRRLCGHHILYWTIYRLKYGLKASVNMITDKSTSERFERFCKCMTDFKLSKCLEQ